LSSSSQDPGVQRSLSGFVQSGGVSSTHCPLSAAQWPGLQKLSSFPHTVRGPVSHTPVAALQDSAVQRSLSVFSHTVLGPFTQVLSSSSQDPDVHRSLSGLEQSGGASRTHCPLSAAQWPGLQKLSSFPHVVRGPFTHAPLPSLAAGSQDPEVHRSLSGFEQSGGVCASHCTVVALQTSGAQKFVLQ